MRCANVQVQMEAYLGDERLAARVGNNFAKTLETRMQALGDGWRKAGLYGGGGPGRPRGAARRGAGV